MKVRAWIELGLAVLSGLAVLIGLILVLAGTAPQAHAADPLACEGYPEKRVYLESQAWWSATERDADAQHIHVGLCYPWAGFGETVSGTLRLNARIQLHHNLGRSERVRIQDWTNQVYSTPVAIGPCEQCEVTVPIDLDTRKIANGLRELRFSVDVVEQDGSRFYNSTGWMIRVQNPDSTGLDQGTRTTANRTESKGWHKLGAAYINALLLSPIPSGPVSGVWPIRWQTNSDRVGDSYAAYVDPSFHAIPPSTGLVIGQGSTGGFNGTMNLDTRLLSNGWHRLVLRADSLKNAGRTSGLQVVGFEVRN